MLSKEKKHTGGSSCVVSPSSTEEVSSIISHCARRKIAVVPQSGNTGLVGGSIPIHDELILSTRKLNKHFEFNETSGESFSF